MDWTGFVMRWPTVLAVLLALYRLMRVDQCAVRYGTGTRLPASCSSGVAMSGLWIAFSLAGIGAALGVIVLPSCWSS